MFILNVFISFFEEYLSRTDNTVSVNIDVGAFVVSNFSNSSFVVLKILIIPVMNNYWLFLFVKGF